MPGGRPTALHAPAGEDADGNPWTTSERVIARKRLGMLHKDIAADAAMSEGTLKFWRSNGAAARARVELGEPITPRAAEYLAFLTAWETAEAEHKATLLGRIETAGTDPNVTRKTTVRHAAPKIVAENGSVTYGEMIEVERTETVEERPGPWTALAWLLERRYPDELGRKMAVDVKDERTSTSMADRAKALSDEVEGFLASRTESGENTSVPVTEKA